MDFKHKKAIKRTFCLFKYVEIVINIYDSFEISK